jgi:NTE family protein
MDATNRKLGLSLSGGGYRAAAFHLGTLRKLQQMNILEHVDIMSTISGGSITGAYYCLNKNDYPSFDNNLYLALQQRDVIKKVLLSVTTLQLALFLLAFLVPAFCFLFTAYAWLFPVLLAACIFLLLKFQFILFPVSKRIEKIYDDFFYQQKTLGDLPDKPLLVIGSTNLETARPFTFSKNWMQDSTYQYMIQPVQFHAGPFPVSRAVMASSSVPFAFTPILIDKSFFKQPTDVDRVHPLLVDGGVYDNQGIHKIVQKGRYECSHIITSDAGGGASGNVNFKNTIALLIATVDVFMIRIKKAQMVQDVYDNAATAKKQVAYFSLAWSAKNCIPGFIKNMEKKQVPSSVIEAHKLPAEWVADPKKFEAEITAFLEEKVAYSKIPKPTDEELKIARNVGTNLTALSKKQVDSLIKQAEALTELQVKLYCPSIVN